MIRQKKFSDDSQLDSEKDSIRQLELKIKASLSNLNSLVLLLDKLEVQIKL
jgi:hypothetical protein